MIPQQKNLPNNSISLIRKKIILSNNGRKSLYKNQKLNAKSKVTYCMIQDCSTELKNIFKVETVERKNKPGYSPISHSELPNIINAKEIKRNIVFARLNSKVKTANEISTNNEIVKNLLTQQCKS